MDILPCFSSYGLRGFEQGEVFCFLAPESHHTTLCLTFCTAFTASMDSILLLMGSSLLYTPVNHGSCYLGGCCRYPACFPRTAAAVGGHPNCMNVSPGKCV